MVSSRYHHVQRLIFNRKRVGDVKGLIRSGARVQVPAFGKRMAGEESAVNRKR